MQYRKVPKTGDEISALSYGCLRYPMKGLAIDEKKTISQIRGAIDRGVNYFDTAWPYHNGKSEVVLGKALLDGYRDKVKIADKITPYMVTNREKMDEILNKQLEKLQTDRIDYYLVHSILKMESWERLKNKGIIDFLEKSKAEGKILNIGFSFHGSYEDFVKVVDDYDGWTFCQIQYNFLDQNMQAGKKGLEYAASKNLAVMIMEPLRGGGLSNKIPPAAQKIWDKAKIKRTPADWALRWIWNHPEVTTVLSGMNVDEHITENIRVATEALPNHMTEEDLDVVDNVIVKYKEGIKVGCTNCRYCMPCPAGVDIPDCFEKYNSAYMFGKSHPLVFYMLRHSDINKRASWASACIECGKCEEHCPQNIKIITELKNVKKTFEGFLGKTVLFFMKIFIKKK